VVYLISGFRWSFYEQSDVSLGICLSVIGLFTVCSLAIIAWIFKTGYRLRK
jgi:ABC-2 type transport system permease protein